MTGPVLYLTTNHINMNVAKIASGYQARMAVRVPAGGKGPSLRHYTNTPDGVALEQL